MTFKPFVDFCIITGMSANGSVAAGVYDDGVTPSDIFRWIAAGGVEKIGVPNQVKNGSVFVSRDGRTLVGTVPDSQGRFHAAIS